MLEAQIFLKSCNFYKLPVRFYIGKKGRVGESGLQIEC